MNKLLYYLVLLPISKLPYTLLYGLSDLLFFVLWYVAGYRKKVVMGNLEKCFPGKKKDEIKAIARKFYSHLCDLVLESVKNFSITRQEASARVKNINPEVLNGFSEKGQSIVVCGGHCGNWELWAVATPMVVRHKMIGIYKKLSNPFFDSKMRETRNKFGMKLVSTRETGEYLRLNADETKALILAFDQSPGDPKKCVWVNFMGQETAAYFGAEKYAREFDYPVVYGYVRKEKRGYYSCEYRVLFEHPRQQPEGIITQKLFEVLEEEIKREPYNWLWSHKRWKHKRPV
ncbi:MAG: lysophospholipid acyltransferase family protein [Flavobacteriales bacterium]|nr:lysophospholipid acyltransferase family protein [Flavobacteriales bacterium]